MAKKSTAGETGFSVSDSSGMTPDAGIEAASGAGLRYVGDGEYIFGVPARDLSAEEAATYATQIAATAAATGRILYQAIEEE